MSRRRAHVVLFVSLAACGRAYDGNEGLLDAEPAKIELSATLVDIGTSACGSTDAPTRQMSLKNAGGSALTWTASLPNGAPFTIAPANGTTAPGESIAITIAGTVLAGDAPAGTQSAIISFNSNDPNTPVIEAVAQRAAAGGMVVVDPQPLVFSPSPVGVAIDAPVSIRNTGTEAVDISLGVPASPAFAIEAGGRAAPIQTKLLPGASVDGLIVRFTPSEIGPFSTAAPLTVTGPSCGARPSTILMEGQGSSSTVAVTPVLIDFGLVSCGTTAAPKPFNVKSAPGGSAFTWSTTLGKGAGSTFALNPPSGSVGAGGTAAVDVAPKAVPTTGGIGTNLYGDVITVSTSAPGDSPHAVTLRMSPSGAVLNVSPTSIDFGDVNTNGNGHERTIVVTNTGNATGTAVFSLAAAAFNIISASTVTVPPGGTGSIVVRAKPGGTGVKTSTITVSSPSPVCAPLPAPIALRCRGF